MTGVQAGELCCRIFVHTMDPDIVCLLGTELLLVWHGFSLGAHLYPSGWTTHTLLAHTSIPLAGIQTHS